MVLREPYTDDCYTVFDGGIGSYDYCRKGDDGGWDNVDVTCSEEDSITIPQLSFIINIIYHNHDYHHFLIIINIHIISGSRDFE